MPAVILGMWTGIAKEARNRKSRDFHERGRVLCMRLFFVLCMGLFCDFFPPAPGATTVPVLGHLR
jgi:hypothetical protein